MTMHKDNPSGGNPEWMPPHDRNITPLGRILAFLTCPLCRHVPFHPVLLQPCEHMYCRDCVFELGLETFHCAICLSRRSRTQATPLTSQSLLNRIWLQAKSMEQGFLPKPLIDPDGPDYQLPVVVEQTRIVTVEMFDAVSALKHMLVGMAAGFAMHRVWPKSS